MRNSARAVLAVSVFLVTTGCGKDADDAAAAAAVPASVAATIDTVRSEAFVEQIDGMGTVIPRIGHVALLAAPSPTRIAKIYVALGDRVATNTVLIDLEQPMFDAAVASADAALRTAEQASARATRLVEAGVAPRKESELAASELAAAQANALTARRARDLSHIKAPFRGVVTRLTAVTGANVDIGQPLIEITDPSTLDIALSIAPDDASRLQPGQIAELFDGAASDSAVGRARIADVSAVVDSATRGVSVRLSLLTSNRTIRIGETVLARIRVSEHQRALVISDEAIVPDGEHFKVFVVDSTGVAHARSVTIGGRALHRVWILDGLKAGERVVTQGAYGVDDGAKIVGNTP